jgi:hypothetical protein
MTIILSLVLGLAVALMVYWALRVDTLNDMRAQIGCPFPASRHECRTCILRRECSWKEE